MNKRLFILIVSILFAAASASAQITTRQELEATMSTALNNFNAGNYKEALEIFRPVVENLSILPEKEEREAYILCQRLVAICYYRLELYEQAYETAGELLKCDLTDQERERAINIYTNSGSKAAETIAKNFEKRRAILTSLLPLVDENSRRELNKSIAKLWFFEGKDHIESHNYEKVHYCQDEALAIFRTLGDTNNTAYILYCSALCFDVEGRYDKALVAIDESCQLYEKLQYSYGLEKALLTKYGIHRKLSDNEGRNRTAQKIDSVAMGTDNADTKVIYNNFKGDEAFRINKFALAKAYYQQNLQYEQFFKEIKQQEYEYSYAQKMRDVCIKTGEYDEALKYAYQALNSYVYRVNKVKGRMNWPYFKIAEIYKKLGDEPNCMAAVDSLFLDEPYKQNVDDWGSLYDIRGRFNMAFQHYEDALADFLKADSIFATRYSEEDANRAFCFAAMANAYFKLENFEETERLYRLYRKAWKTNYENGKHEYIRASFYYANAEAHNNHISEGCQDYIVAMEEMKEWIRTRLSFCTAMEREELWKEESEYTVNMTPFAIKAERLNDEFTRSCYDALLISKAFLLDYERSAYEAIAAYGTKADVDEYEEIMALRNRILELEKNFEQNKDQIVELTASVTTKERVLAQKSSVFADIMSFMNVDYNTVQQALGPNDVVVDFTDYVSRSEGRKYAAFVVKREQQNPQLVPLFAERAIDSLNLVRPDMYYDKEFAAGILEMLWEPIGGHIAEHSTVYYVPSHLLFQIALESLPLPDGSLLGDHYNFVRLSSAREILRVHHCLEFADGTKDAILYGGLKYNLNSDDLRSQAHKYEVPSPLAMRGDNAVRGLDGFDELSQTGLEVKTIRSVLSSHDVAVTLRDGAQGTEESFLSMHGHAPAILHVATHGFYYTPDKAKNVEYLKGYADAMALSGLVFSGCNTAWKGGKQPEGVLSGILTANVIAAMDLRGVEMVVLAACKSGQGQATSEGLYGLQRAFKKAGVQTIVMTLWEVNDNACRDFMEMFYAHLADPANNWDKRRAFEAAKRSLMQDERYRKPYFWAPFVMLD